MTKLILARHGETDVNVAGLIHKTNDTATLSRQGLAQVHATAMKLKEIGVSKIMCSDEARAVETAKMISQHVNQI